LFSAPRFLGSISRFAVYLLAAAALPFLTSSAKAECGDYVHVQTDAAKKSPAPVDNKPCQGPNCSKSPVHAPLVPVTAPTNSVDQSLLAGPASAAAFQHVSRITSQDLSFWPSGHPLGLERPPRF
jgi:hypothetical protein